MSRSTRILVVLCLALISGWWFLGDGAGGKRRSARGQSGYHAGTAYLEGTVLTDPEIPGPYVQFEVSVRFGAEPGEVMSKSEAAHDGGHFSISGLPPGEATLRVGVGRLGEALIEIAAISIPEQGPVRDARLEDLDLRGRLNVFEFTVLDPNGEPLDEAMVGYRPVGGTRYVDEVALVDRVARIVSPEPLLDVVVLAPGLRVREEEGVSQSGEIGLREGIPVQLVLPADLDPAGDSVVISVRLVRAEPDPRLAGATEALTSFLAESGEYAFRAAGEVDLTLGSPGTYEVQWRLLKQDGSESWDTLPVQHLERPRIEVLDDYDGQRFSLAFPRAAYHRALGR